MSVDKLSISLQHDLSDAVRLAAERGGTSISGWLAEAALDKLRHEELGLFLDAWEVEHGTITKNELVAARRKLGTDRAQ